MPLSSPQAPIAGMRRIVTLDALAPGEFNVYPLDGNVFITGENAAGKSTLLNMLALQAGGRIIDLTTTEATLNHYFRTLTSYVILEYLHRDGYPRCAIIWRADTSAGHGAYRFRFVRGEVVREMFVTDEGVLIPPVALGAQLRRLGYDFTAQIETTATFRAVLQGDDRIGDRSLRKDLRNWIAHYSLAVPGSRLTDLEKLISAMITRKTPYETFVGVLADKISDEVNLAPVGGQDEFKTWLRNYRAVREVAGFEGRVTELVRLDDSRRSKLTRLGLLRAEAEAVSTGLDSQLEELTEIRQLKAGELSESEISYETRRQSLKDRQSDQLIHQRSAQTQIETILSDKEHRARSGVAEQKDKLDGLPSLRSRLHTETALLDRLMGDTQNIELQFSRLLAESKEQVAAELEAVRVGADEKRQQVREHDALVRDEADHERHQESTRWDAESLSLEEQLSKLDAAAVRAQERMNSIAVDPKLQAALSRARDAERGAFTALHARKDDLRAADARLEAARREIEGCERDISTHRLNLAGRRSDLAALDLRITPPAGSPLALLMEGGTDWTSTIGKVLDPGLLTHTGLKPAFGEVTDSLFGLTLDLRAIEDHVGPKLQHLEQDREVLVEQIRTIDAALLGFEQQLKKASLARIEAQREVSEQSHAVDLAAAECRRSEELILSAEAAINQAIATERERRFVEQLQTAETLHNHRQRALEARQRHNEQLEAIRSRSTRRLDELRAALGAIDDRLNSDQAAIRATGQARQSELAAEKAGRLAGEGIDPVRLQGIEHGIRELEVEIRSTEALRDTVERWLSWTRSILTDLPGLEARRDAAGVALEQITSEIAHLTQEQSEFLAQRRNELARITEEAGRLSKAHQEILRLIEDLADFRPGPVPVELRSVPQIKAEVINVIETCKLATRSCEKEIGEIKRAFSRHPGTPPDEYITGREAAADGPKTLYQWIPHFRDWFEREGRESDNILRISLESSGGQLNDFHQSLKRAQSVIGNWNRELQTGFNSTMQFATVTDMEVNITSQVHELESWSLVRRFSEKFGAWVAAGKPSDLDDDFAGLIREMSESRILQRGLQVDIASLIGISGRIIESGAEKTFRRASDLAAISSNGVTNILMTYLLIAFTNVIRNKSRVRLAFPFDEIGAISEQNIRRLVQTLNANDIHVISATTGGKEAVADLFDYRLRFDYGGVVQATRESIREPLQVLETRAEAEAAHQARLNQVQSQTSGMEAETEELDPA